MNKIYRRFFLISLLFSVVGINSLDKRSFSIHCQESSSFDDIDGDGLPNSWEEGPIDANNDGVTDYDISNVSDPRHKDVFVEVDYMEYHKPLNESIQMVVDSFHQAPVCNPDGTNGINLHIKVDEQIPHIKVINLGKLEEIKNRSFGTPSERSLNNTETMGIKDYIYYYSVFAHKHSDNYSGQAIDIPSKAFMITLGVKPWAVNPENNHRVGNLYQQSGTFMHELGHALGLAHGGSDPIHYKPNYLSVMNYAFQMPSNLYNRSLDYSSGEDPFINENNVSEINGIKLNTSDLSLQTIIFAKGLFNPDNTCPLPELVVGNSPVDINHDGLIGNSVVADVNCDSKFDILFSNNDWQKLQYLNPTNLVSNSDNVSEDAHGLTELTNVDDLYHLLRLLNSTKAIIQNVIQNVQISDSTPFFGEAPFFMNGTAGLNASEVRFTIQQMLNHLRIQIQETFGTSNMDDLLSDLNNEGPRGVVANAPIDRLLVTDDFSSAINKLSVIQNNLNNTRDDIARIVAGDFVGQFDNALDSVDNTKKTLERYLSINSTEN